MSSKALRVVFKTHYAKITSSSRIATYGDIPTSLLSFDYGAQSLRMGKKQQ